MEKENLNITGNGESTEVAENVNGEKYDSSGITVLKGLEAVRMREKEEYVLTQIGLPRSNSYTE